MTCIILWPMTSDERSVLNALLREQRVLTLGVVVEGAPVLGLLPFARASDGAVLVHASRLAKHTQGLRPGARAAVLVHAPDTGDALQVPRLTLDVEVHGLTPQTPAFDEGRAAYLARFPEAEVTFGLGDFALFALRPRGGRLVVGFGRARDVGPDDLTIAV